MLRSIRTSPIALVFGFLACAASGQLLAATAKGQPQQGPQMQQWYAPPTWYRAAPARPESQLRAPSEIPSDTTQSNADTAQSNVERQGRISPQIETILAPLAYTFTPISPCRQYNTLSPVAPLLQGVNRTITLTGLAPCNIPTSAVAVSANITVFNIIGASGNGVFKLDIVSPPTVAWINYPPTEAQRGNAGIVALNASGQIVVQVAQGAGQIDFVVDVNGYYSATELEAIVNADGTLARGIHTTGSLLIGGFNGSYEVDFDRDVTPCFWVATIGNPGAGNPSHGTIVTAARSGNSLAAFVETRNVGGTLTNLGFILHLTCPP